MQKNIKFTLATLDMQSYLLELLSKNKNEYIHGYPTLCLSCDRTGCKLHSDAKAEDHPVPCEWLQKKARLPKGAEYAATISEAGEIRVQVLSCPKFTNEIGW